ncbi:hypothetical protein GCM10009557_10170 [Virgisporangium ochraceum]|uniref:Uncharacterized protein n=1 Tax=Virgisporangium ochraceum TaxID=65505 RepID=A0A8J4A028_9ACTN|nr:hypothetical protein [Virgisporangium ochraceum]GIJ73247.1 hypothetical protein Voc01_081640 [Virgisporangium ochraceum]
MGVVRQAVALFGATFLPEEAVPYLGLLPLALGIKAGVRAWRHRNDPEDEAGEKIGGPATLEGAAVTFVNGGRSFATRPVVAKELSRWGHVLLPPC